MQQGGLADAVIILKQGIHEVAAAAEAREAHLREQGATAARAHAEEAARLEGALACAEADRDEARKHAVLAEERCAATSIECAARVASERACSSSRVKVALTVGMLTSWATGAAVYALGAIAAL